MKFLAAILMFYFSLLIAQPMVTLVHNGLTKEKQTCTMGCCHKHEQSEKKQTPKLPFGCCNDMSNPFTLCCCCTGFIPEYQNTGNIILPGDNKLVFSNTEVLISNYCSDCWRPPKLVA